MSLNQGEKELAKLIHVIVECGSYVEAARIELAKNTNFSPFGAFRRINASSTGFVTEDDLDNFLRATGLTLPEEALYQFLSIENDKTYKLTYNNFLNQVLPTTDIKLRNSCLERPTSADHEVNFADVDHLISTIYQKENEYTRAVEASKTRLSSFGNSALEQIFQSLTDDVTGYLSFKSLSTFMKHNNYTFDKKDYESFMSKIDKNLTGRVSPTDFKYLLFPHGVLAHTNRDHDKTHQKAGSIFSGISPIKNWTSSPNKNTAQKPFEEIDRSLLALKNRSPQDKLPHEQDRKTYTSQSGLKAPSALKSANKYGNPKIPFEGAPDSRAILYNQEIAAINDHIMLQNAPETTYKDKDTKNPLEWRYMDPVYHNYWSYHRDHNRTLSPDYFNRAEGRSFPHNQHSHKNPARPGTGSVPFFNPTFVDPGTYENLERYPDNPFRYTDHGHFFKNYYANLRHNYYDQYYNYVPYKAKIPSSKSERNSPSKPRYQSQNNSPNHYQPNLNASNYNGSERPTVNPPRREISIPRKESYPIPTYQPDNHPRRTAPEQDLHRPSIPRQTNNAPYEFVYVGSDEIEQPKSAIRIEKQPFIESPRLPKNYTYDKPKPQDPQDYGNKPYTFVIVNSQNDI